MDMKRYILMSVLVLGLVLAGCQSSENISTINVNGHAEMTVSPDTARVYVGVNILKPTAEEAQDEANRVVNAIIDNLRYEGISKSDIETETLQLYEERDWVYIKPEPVYDDEIYYEERPTEVSRGWRAIQTLKVKTTDLDMVGDIVDVAVRNGANQINYIEFYLSSAKEDEYKHEVLAMASENAKSKAETMADSLGARLVRIKSASESNWGYSPYRYSMANDAGVPAVQESATVLPKDVSVSADISLVYEIKG